MPAFVSRNAARDGPRAEPASRQSTLADHEIGCRFGRYKSLSSISRIWVAIGFREWRPRITHPPIQIVRFGPRVFNTGVEEHVIEHVPVRIYEPAKTIVDLFFHAFRQQRWYGSKVDVTQALQGMKKGLRLRKATPAEIARYAHDAGIWENVQPYLEALTVDA